MSKIPWRAVAAALAGALLLSCNPESPKFALTSTERRGVLESNGLRFVIMPDPTTKLVEVDVHYDVGSREDPMGKAGLAHLVEHLMFQTRPDGPNTPPIFQTLLDLTTFVNAFTEWDATHYWSTVRAENVDAMLKIEAMRMFYAADVPGSKDVPGFGCSTLPEKEFERERDVVRNEIRAGSKPEEYVRQLVEAAMYPQGHAYQREIGGNDQQIAGLQLADACQFMKNYYAPERATLIIAGDVDIDKTVDMIKKWFGKIPKRTPAPRVAVAPFETTHKTVTIQADVERPSVWIGWALPPSNTPEGEAAQYGIYSTVGRLAMKSQQYDFAYGVGAGVIGGKLAPLFTIQVQLKGLNRLDDALEFAQHAAKEAYRGWNEGTSEDIEEEKNRQKADFVANLEELSSRTVQMGYLVQFSKEVDFNSTDQYIFHELDKISSFDNAKIAGAVKKWIDWDKATIVIVKPNKEGIKGDTRSKVKFSASPSADTALENVDVDPREALHPIKVSTELKSMAEAKRFKLGNGMDVVMLPVHAMPLATAELIFKNAGEASTPDTPGLGFAAARFLHRVADLDPQMQRNTDVYSRTGIEISCFSGDDDATCLTHGVNIYLDVMVRGLERLVKAGEYSQDQIEQFQKRTKENFKLQSTQEETEYVRQVYAALYGPEHPYTKASYITPQDANKLHRDLLDSFRRKHYTAGNATLVLVGNFDVKYAEKLVRDTFGDWDRGSIDQPVSRQLYKRTGPLYIGVVESKDDQQVNVTVAYPAPAGVDGQEAARQVLANILNQRAEDMRFKLGSTYGLYFGRQAKIGPTGYILRGGAVIGGTIDAERGGETLKALRASIDSLRNGDAEFDEQFVRARRQIIQHMLGQSTVTFELAARLAHIAQFGLDINYYNTLLQQVAAVSPAQVRALIKQELDPNNEVIVVLGDKAHLDKTFGDAGIKDVKIVEPEYK
ncbi:MAG: M16 family metallopeptidase [Acidobacteriota bacterium]